MPISLNCSRCGHPLLAPDERAGLLIRCPLCETVSTVPQQLPAEQPVAPQVAPKAVPAPSQPPDEAAEILHSLPEATPEETPAAEPETAFPAFDSDSSSEPSKKWKHLSARKPTPGQWRPFADGCRLVKWGLWIELLGILIFIVFCELLILVGAKVIELPELPKSSSLAVLFFPLGLFFLGSCAIGAGRISMMRLPSDTGAYAVLSGAALMSCLRVVALGFALAFLVMALLEDIALTRTSFMYWVGRLYAIAMLAGIIAEVSSVPGMAVVGGAIPNERLRKQAGFVSFVFQVFMVAWIALIVLVTFAEASADFLPRLPTQRPPTVNSRPGPPLSRDLLLRIGLSIPLVIFLLQAAYTYMQCSLYAAGQRIKLDKDEQ